jgi:molecular chaperone HtpG
MYVDPLTIYREYVQNSADAITLGRTRGLFPELRRPQIQIHIDDRNRTIRIRDNAAGVPADQFWNRMTSVGASQKRGQRLRGFRGVGRLSGLGYAQEVVFRSRAPGESVVNELSWDSRKLRELLRDAHYEGTIEDVVGAIVAHSGTAPAEGSEPFFEVELRKVTRVKNDLLLNPEEVRRYLSQVAPAPFPRAFGLGERVERFLGNHGVTSDLDIVLNGDSAPITRPFVDTIEFSPKIRDKLADVELIEIPGVDGSSIDAVGWIAHHSYLGAIPRRAGVAGLRVRCGNIQVGGGNILESLFQETRFNSWCIGELHVLSDRIVPNGRRDDFEVNAHYQNFQGHVAALAHRLSKTCRDRSMQRNRLRTVDLLTMAGQEQLLVIHDRATPSVVRDYYRSQVSKTIARLGRATADPKFRPDEKDHITSCSESLAKGLEKAPTARASPKALAFLPAKDRKVFLETMKWAIASCDSPQHAARMARKVFDRARRRHARR